MSVQGSSQIFLQGRSELVRGGFQGERPRECERSGISNEGTLLDSIQNEIHTYSIQIQAATSDISNVLSVNTIVNHARVALNKSATALPSAVETLVNSAVNENPTMAKEAMLPKLNKTVILAKLDAFNDAVAVQFDTTLYKEDDPYRWDKYLTGTYWLVPTDALPAQFHRNSSILPVEQQTVYFIENSNRGVFRGWIVTQFTTQAAGVDFPISCQDMFGTIAPRGEISLTVVTPSTGGVNKPWPVSYMVKARGRWLNMVLASTIVGDSAFITHGPTFMTPITPRSPYWDDLPGSPGSVPDFVSLCGHQVV